MTKILGISAFYHDSAAALIIDGDIRCAAQEERFSRIKHDPSFPIQAIQYCLQSTDTDLQSIDAIVFYDKPLLKFERLLETYLATAPKGFLSFLRAMPIWLKEKLYLKSVLRTHLRKLIHQQRAKANSSLYYDEVTKEKKPKVPQLLFCEHHESHAAAAYFPSPFDDAAILCLDGVGEWATSSAWRGQSGNLSPLFEIHFPHSLGLLYSAFTQYCGFKVNSGEYKLMGLAPYGEPIYTDLIKQKLVKIREDGSFSLDMDYFDYAAGNTMTNAKFHSLFEGPAHPLDADTTQKQMDLARSIQVVTEEIVLNIAQHLYQQTGCKNLCLAGGVALNCVSNGRLKREGPFKNIWVQPAAGDAGSAIGAALQVWHKYFQNPKTSLVSTDEDPEFGALDHMKGGYLGSSFTSQDVIKACESKTLVFSVESDDNLYTQVASYLDQGKVLGWFQDAMEFGPRALGNRSILGDARNTQMQSQMNLKIKQRESFRPFAPAVLSEDAGKWFDLDVPSPYMLLVANVKEEHCIKLQGESASGLEKLHQIRSSVPAITHVDYSARVQTVHRASNPKFHRLISEFKNLSGLGMVINTSFNVRGEPPVCSPDDAIRCFLATDMDVLVMQNVVLLKSEQPADQIELAKTVRFEKD
ncbi:carbamoyltransferase [Glaciecola sp. SC05]|uniref:carbamoyltransferase family protein n=1 Tax=Glaciecola sp. SC05 TaxID=1987355 RepID=UPI0035280668